MAKGRFIKKPKKSILEGKSENEAIRAKEKAGNDYFIISLRHFDPRQGQTFSEWEEKNILAQTMETLRNYCCDSIQNQLGEKFTIYGDFPSDSEFYHPKHVPEDAEWARIHINGTVIVAGHVERNIFHVVFLDKDHRFCISKKKHT